MTLDVQARKVVVDEAGVETEVPMDDWVQIGVFAPAAHWVCPQCGATMIIGAPLTAARLAVVRVLMDSS